MHCLDVWSMIEQRLVSLSFVLPTYYQSNKDCTPISRRDLLIYNSDFSFFQVQLEVLVKLLLDVFLFVLHSLVAHSDIRIHFVF